MNNTKYTEQLQYKSVRI